ncbi:hypothetical protein Poli38472_002740 [Pythium oligandrum]|uniref:Cation/H+ exchanger transmembrane domain-containing protein n=1 Tax=Pythium oligandrum TaxID=41045 RepID=A0A8K1CIQ8_PYTOL|nr:hypothetical protein Poli38472_002740 [Pythium oligandrum]|eukprot:TMW63799.1 hypothetical protein Poli38472_002740 [Pythium oligandrum]
MRVRTWALALCMDVCALVAAQETTENDPPIPTEVAHTAFRPLGASETTRTTDATHRVVDTTTGTPAVSLLTDEQLKAIGVKPPVQSTAAKRPVVEANEATVVTTKTTQEEEEELSGSVAADVSINHVEAHLHILQQLELSVARSIEQLNGPHARRPDEVARLNLELQAVQNNLKKLAEGLDGTLQDLEVVEKDTELKSKKLKEVLQHQKEEQEEQFIEANGIKVVDYETGRIRNTTGLSRVDREKLHAAEMKADPAVLHYDFELLGQIAILLGVAAIGGIVATYFNIPPNIGYLLGGALVGPSCLMVVQQYKEVETISLFGSIFLLFGHGAGYTPQEPDQRLKKYFVGGMAYLAATVVLVALVSVYIGWSASFSEGMVIGVAVCFTTTAPLSEHIRTNQIHDTSYGKTVIAIIAVQDILMSFALGTPEWFAVRSVGWIGVAAVRSIIAYSVVVVMALGLHLHIVPRLLSFLTAMEQVHHAPLVLLGVVSVCLFMALFTESIGLSLECGAFLAGLAFVNVSRDAQTAFTSIRVMENLFGSMFFACVGMILNPIFLVKNAGEILSMVILIVVIKTFAMTIVMRFFHVALDKALLAGAGLCQIGELALIFMIKAHATQLVSRRIYLLFVAAIAVFLGCSSFFNRQIVLARRKNVFRLPTASSRRLQSPKDNKSHDHHDDDNPASPVARERRSVVSLHGLGKSSTMH